MVSSNDMESFNSNAMYLSDNLQPLPYTPFAAMLAKQQQNYASGSDQDNRSIDTYSIGVLGKNSVKEVSHARLLMSATDSENITIYGWNIYLFRTNIF